MLAFGADMLWYPVGWTAGYLVLLVLVAAPLRRSGAYTLPDFAEARLASPRGPRGVARCWWWRSAGSTCCRSSRAPGFMEAALGAPRWLGAVVVAVVVLVNVLSGGMRSITFVQAFQYWLKLTALLVPAVVLLGVWVGDGAPNPADAGHGGDSATLWSLPLGQRRRRGLYLTYSLIVATFLGTMGLPARGGPLLHQPRRPRRPPYDAGGAGPARHLLPAAAGLRRARPGLRRVPRAPTSSCWSCPG